MTEAPDGQVDETPPQLGARPFLAVYVAWHPKFEGGATIARALYDHFRRDLFQSVAGGAGLPLYYRSTADESGVPAPVNFEESELSATILLIEDHLIGDPQWSAWAKSLEDAAESSGLRNRIFPVAASAAALTLNLRTNFIRWDKWGDRKQSARLLRLTTDLAYQFSRMLRLHLEHDSRSLPAREQLLHYLQRIQLFLSHSKHDDQGVRIATAIRDALHAGDGLASFFDVHDIPPGLPFDDVILESVRESAVIAIHTDSYSSRTWCRKEVLQAKRHQVPLVIANCIDECDERAFPYLGNVPVVRINPQLVDRVDVVVGRLLDEVLKDYLWKCWTNLVRRYSTPRDVFLPRAPEILSLAYIGLPFDARVLVYPEPPLSIDETDLFESIDPKVQLRSMIEWIAERGL